eukprot:1461143-Rhodomonas_salina.2
MWRPLDAPSSESTLREAQRQRRGSESMLRCTGTTMEAASRHCKPRVDAPRYTATMMGQPQVYRGDDVASSPRSKLRVTVDAPRYSDDNGGGQSTLQAARRRSEVHSDDDEAAS